MNSTGGGMIRLWRYWPLRVVTGWVRLAPVVGLSALGGYGLVSGRLALGLGALGAAALWGVGCGAGLKRIDRAAGLAPLREREGNKHLRVIGLMLLPFLLSATGLVAVNALFPDNNSLPYFARVVVVLLAIFPPFLFAANACPRNRLHWAALAICIPAMHAVSLFAPFVAGFLLRILSDGVPGIAAMLGTIALAYIALNAPFAILLANSGACPWKVELAEAAEEAEV